MGDKICIHTVFQNFCIFGCFPQVYVGGSKQVYLLTVFHQKWVLASIKRLQGTVISVPANVFYAVTLYKSSPNVDIDKDRFQKLHRKSRISCGTGTSAKVCMFMVTPAVCPRASTHGHIISNAHVEKVL